ncbi:MAG: ABC transporter substrate-binding protein [Candidatus Bathyarchaeota archaeon]|nr:ABC transporter substrate-binding protein [Candidatus Bathyarchaeota archaeon]
MGIYVATIEGGVPETVDPAWCYDTASAELIFNVYDTLLYFDGESLEHFIPQLATEYTLQEVNWTSPEGLFCRYRYTFKIRQNVNFTSGHLLTPKDVEYSIERGMIQDRCGGPQWMFYEPLLNSWGAEAWNIGTATVPGPEAELVGKMIDHAVESNATHVWFNLAFPGPYAPFLQILSQSWSSILSKQWVNEYVIGTLHRPEWPGDWPDYTSWLAYHDPAVSPLDDPSPIMCGTGPYKLVILDYAAKYWTVERNVNYWRGWPAEWPAPPYPSDPAKNPTPAGYVDTATVTWAYEWPARSSMFLAGDVDFCAVPREYIGTIVGQPGLRCTYPLPVLAVGSLFFTFDVDPATPYGTINDYGVFTADGIPRDFFGNPTWGIHTRLAFAYAFDYTTYLQTAFLGEAIAPATAIIPGLVCYDGSIPGYTYNIDKAYDEFSKVPGLVGTGFTVTVTYNTGNIPRQRACEKLKEGIDAINAKYHTSFVVNIVNIDWKPYLGAMVRSQLATFIIGWLADYPDPHNFAFPFYHSEGTFAACQKYSNPTMDDLIKKGIEESDPVKRCQIYHDIQVLARQETPSIPLYQAVGRHFERDWVVGWHYNTISPGIYFYNLWKWYYVPHSEFPDYPPYDYSNRLPEDVNYDGKVDMKDIGYTCKSYGATYGPPLHERWHFRCDINNDRKIDMKDIGFAAKDYGKTSSVWAPPP